MKTTTLRILLIALVALLALTMIGCKSESSPTAPPNTSTVPPGGVTPPSGATVTLTVSNANPLVSSQVVVTATVSQNGAAVPDGTAVQFTTTIGTFADTGTNTTIRTTTGGVAKATLTSSSAGTATITATVNNVSKTTSVTFTTIPTTTPPPNTSPTISSVCVITGTTCTVPATGIPAGGQQVVINGTNFRQPVRVLFDPGNGQPAKEAFVSSVTATQIIAVAPPFDLTTGQTLPVTITVIDEAGTVNEQKVSAQNAFTYQLAVLTPVIRALSPTSGPIDGGTRVSIFGDAFQAPVQVFFGAAEAQVIKVTFNEIDVMSPTARDTSSNGSGIVTGPVNVRVLNVGSGKDVTATGGFRYIAKMAITSVNPTNGSAFGGTDITIDGVGFNDPLTVDIGGVRAQVLRVSGTEILARTGSLASPCASGGGPVTVTNVDNGDVAVSAAPQAFIYIGVNPVIASITSTTTPPQPGNSLTILVQNPGVGPLGNALVNFTVGGLLATTTPVTIANGATQTFSVIVPNIPIASFTQTQACIGAGGVPGVQKAPQDFEVKFTNTTTNCTATAVVTIAPPAGANPCVIPPPPTATVTAPASGCANAGSVVAAGANTGTAQITIANTGGQTLTIAANPPITGTNAGDFTIAPTTGRTVNPASSVTYTITFDPSAIGPRSASVTFTTNDPVNPTVTVCLQGNGT
jgi:IPT/TIG domain